MDPEVSNANIGVDVGPPDSVEELGAGGHVTQARRPRVGRLPRRRPSVLSQFVAAPLASSYVVSNRLHGGYPYR